MSTPICSRCQKIYTSGSAPVKCTNCGGSIRIPGAASIPEVKPAPSIPAQSAPIKVQARSCSMYQCTNPAEKSLKYFNYKKQVIIASLTPVPDEYAQDLCLIHETAFINPKGWTLLRIEKMPMEELLQTSKPVITPVAPRPRSSVPEKVIARDCSMYQCTNPAAKSLKYFNSLKEIVLTPLTPTPDPTAQDLCDSHADQFMTPKDWHLAIKSEMPLEPEVQDSALGNLGGAGLGCLGTIFFWLAFGFVVWLVIQGFSSMSENGVYIVRWRR